MTTRAISHQLEDDAQFLALVSPVWDYLALNEQPQPSDVIFVFGGLDLAVPTRAAELYSLHYAPIVLVTGNAGALTKEVFSKPEAIVFRDRMVELGVPSGSVILELTATNTYQNVSLGMRTLRQAGRIPTTALLVAKSFLMRRCYATFLRQYPEVQTRSCPPQGSLLHFCDRPRHEFAERLVAELERLDSYSVKGDIAALCIPASVRAAASTIRQVLTALDQ
ncbi:YdcF family protein [bacterium]|nr:YdcF family protein [bacterium]